MRSAKLLTSHWNKKKSPLHACSGGSLFFLGEKRYSGEEITSLRSPEREPDEEGTWI